MNTVKLPIFSALLCNATRIAVAQNHGLGTMTPSDADRSKTNKIIEVGKVLVIQLLDHIILTADRYYSFREGACFLIPQKFHSLQIKNYCILNFYNVGFRNIVIE